MKQRTWTALILCACSVVAVLVLVWIVSLSPWQTTASSAGPERHPPQEPGREVLEPVSASSQGAVRTPADVPERVDLSASDLDSVVLPSRVTNPLTIRVVDALSMVPIEGAQVRITATDLMDSTRIVDVVQASTDQGGRVRLDPVLGALGVCAFTDDGRFGAARVLNDPDEGSSLVDVPVRALATIRGIVRDKYSKAPISGARLRNHASEAMGRTDTVTDSEGRFEFATWTVGDAATLTVEARGYGKGHMTLLVHPEHGWARLGAPDALSWNQVPPFVEFELSPEETIRGRVIREDGSGVEGARVRAMGRVFASSQIGVPDEGTTHSGRDGSFSLCGLRMDVPHVVVCEHPTEGRALRLAPEGETVKDVGAIALAPSAGVGGVVLNQRGLPLAGATIELRIEVPPLTWANDASSFPRKLLSSLCASSTVDPQGCFHVEAMPAEEALLQIKLGGYEVARRSLHLLPGSVIDLGLMEVDSDIELLEGVLQDSRGRPVSRHELVVCRTGSRPWARIKTEEDGHFAVAVRPALVSEVTIVMTDDDGSQSARWARSVDSFPVCLRVPGEE
jgi:Carboxypeptidase regulatory-like domain